MVDVWYEQAALVSSDELREMRIMLPTAERLACERFLHEDDLRTAVLTRWMVRWGLSATFGRFFPADWTFKRNRYGRPLVSNPGSGALAFSISHTRGLVVCAFALNAEVGIDVEPRDRVVSLHLAEMHFAAWEREVLSRIPAEQRSGRFIQFWTLKESYLKARGIGLRVPLEKVVFDMGEKGATLIDAPGVDVSRWQFYVGELPPAHTVAIAYNSELLSPFSVRFTRATSILL